jgi:hypothetical protein
VLGDPASARVTIGAADGSAVRFETPVVEEAGFTAAWVDDARRQLEVRCEGRGRVGGHLFSITLPGDHPRVKNALVPVSATLVARLEFPDGDRVDRRRRHARATRRVASASATRRRAADHPGAVVTPAAAAPRRRRRWSIDGAAARGRRVALPAQTRARRWSAASTSRCPGPTPPCTP